MLFKKISNNFPQFRIMRDSDLCIGCKVCIGQCSYDAHFWNTARAKVAHDNSKCTGCQRCAALCPTGALTILDGKCVSRHSAANRSEVVGYRDSLVLDCSQSHDLKEESAEPVLRTALRYELSLEVPFVLGITPHEIFNPRLQQAMDSVAGELGIACGLQQVTKLIPAGDIADSAIAAVRAGAQILSIECAEGMNQAMPVELALACVDRRLRHEGLRANVSIVAGGRINCSSDVLKVIALGADAVDIYTPVLSAVGCAVCGHCHTGKCPWGIATVDPKLCKRQNPEIAAEQIVGLVRVWSAEMKEMLLDMGLDSIEKLCGNRDKLRFVGICEAGIDILGVKHAG